MLQKYLLNFSIIFLNLLNLTTTSYGHEDDIRYLFVNNISNIRLYTWDKDRISEKTIYTASDSFFILSFDVTKNGKNAIIVEAIPYYRIENRTVNPNESYYGIERTNLLWMNLLNQKIKLIKTVRGDYGEGAKCINNVWLSPNEKFLCIKIMGWECSWIEIYHFPNFSPLSHYYEAYQPLCWSKDGNCLYVEVFNAENRPSDTIRYDLVKLEGTFIHQRLDSLLKSSKTAIKSGHMIYSPDGSKMLFLDSKKNIIIKNIKSGKQKVLLKYTPTSPYQYASPSDIIRAVWK